jgi:hypothetical protein
MQAPGATIITEVSSRYYPMQDWLNGHMDLLLSTWWVVFFGILLFLCARFFIYAPAVLKTHRLSDRELIHDYVDDKTSSNFLFIDEIKQDVVLRLFGGAILIGFLFTFAGWQMNKQTTLQGVEQHIAVCWPFFQNCHGLIFLETLPHGYSQTIVFMGLFSLIFLGVYALLAKRIVLAHVCIGILFAAKMYFTIINYDYNANYDYYHTTFAFVYLFLPYKRFFGAFVVAFFYFLSTATKIHPGWLLGTYFSTLQTGLPIFPDETIPVWTGLVVFMEMIGTWFLFSRHKILQRMAVFFFATFHVYSGILVGYFYPTIVLPSLLIFFGPLYKPFEAVPFNRKALLGWLFMALLFMAQMVSHLIPGDEKLTAEGNFYGLYMFEANHQCDVVVNGDMGIAYEITTRNARARCDVYEYWFRMSHRFCDDTPPKRYGFVINHSINGGPFYQIVDEPDLCGLSYKPFAKNDWIKDEKTAQIISMGDRYNFYR